MTSLTALCENAQPTNALQEGLQKKGHNPKVVHLHLTLLHCRQRQLNDGKTVD